MKEIFRKIPKPLCKVIALRFAAGTAALLMLGYILLSHGSWKFVIPCLAVAIVFFTAGLQLLADCSENKFITISGTCCEVERNGIRKRIKSISVRQGKQTIRLPHPNLYGKTFSTGDEIVVYVASNAPVYDVDGYQVICNILAISKMIQSEEQQ